jgi:hypothetical protein
MGPVAQGFLASFLAGLLTAVGALPVLFGSRQANLISHPGSTVLAFQRYPGDKP